MTEFERMKQRVDVERNLMAQGQARVQALTEEETRIFTAVTETTKQKVSEPEEVRTLAESENKSIENDVLKMKEIFQKAGRSY